MDSTKRDFASKLEIRTKQFSASIFLLVDALPKTMNGNSLGNQLFRSSSSIGANYREANRAKSKADFKNKIRICESEASETYYWLELIEELNLIQTKSFVACKKEANELLALFTSISNKLRVNTPT